MNKTTKISIMLIICILVSILFAPSTYANIEFIEDISKFGMTLCGEQDSIVEEQLVADKKFDLRTVINIRIKNQQNTQQCWAFASNTVLETNLLLTKNQEYDFSERHMVYATARNFTDAENEWGYNREANQGGNEFVALGYYTSGRGPILEEEMPFSTSVGRIPISEIEGKTVQKKVTDYIVFPSIAKEKDTNGNIIYKDPDSKTGKIYSEEEVQAIRVSIKNHIKNYGAVFATTISGSISSQYYNYGLDEPALFCNGDVEPNHQIAIIGWDDEYPVTNFNESNRPSSPGAYLAVNSYGISGTFKTGCFYISYEDVIVEKYGMVGIINVEDIDYDKIYQYDPLGYSKSISYTMGNTNENATVLYGANLFKKDKKTLETINEISITSAVEEQFELYINAQDGEMSLDKLKKIETDQTMLRPGYITIKLETPIEVSGEEFVIAVKYIGGNKNAVIGVEAPNGSFWETATGNVNESYFSLNGERWIDLNAVNNEANSQKQNTNICIKAFTSVKSHNIISDSYIIEKDLIYKVSPNTTVSNFKENVQTSGTLKFLDGDIELEESAIITTGTILNVDEKQNYTIAVCGDITRNGQITLDDITQIKLYLLGRLNLTELGQKAADVNATGEVTLTDLTQMKAARLGLINL